MPGIICYVDILAAYVFVCYGDVLSSCPELVLANCLMSELIKQCIGRFSCIVLESYTYFQVCSVNV